ncbi:hypothetical protein [Bernardetia sp.]|uniref:hypothetical protein n=1 Tax=Bernardetia sp. TaxID=1937974 RepID=UPI0025B7ACAE|nr:hypothetical protein [Bernardetia sp.]
MNYNILAFLTISFLFYSCSNEAKKEIETTDVDFGTKNAQFRNTETKNVSPYAMFGDSSFVLMTEEERNNKNYLEIVNQDNSQVSRLEMDSKTGKVSLFDKNGTVLKTFFIDTKDVAKFLSVDPLAKKYPDISPYAFVANSPLQYTDPDGRIIVDKDGNIVVTATGESHTANASSELVTKLDGKTSYYEVEYDYDVVTIYANDGRPISANLVTAVRLITMTVDDKTGKYKKTIKAGTTNDIDCETNCHGLTFTNERLRISNPDVNDILAGDNHEIVDNEVDADAIIFSDFDGDTNHSANRNEDGTYDANDGDAISFYNIPLSEARGLSDPRKDIFIKKSPNRAFHTDRGNVSDRGIRLIEGKRQIRKFEENLQNELNKK